MLTAVHETALDTINSVNLIKIALMSAKQHIRSNYKFYSQDLINNLFKHPYTKIEFVMRDLNISRLTATKYLDALTDDGTLKKHKIGRSNYYINTALYGILTGAPAPHNETN
jgi:Fic family protein